MMNSISPAALLRCILSLGKVSLLLLLTGCAARLSVVNVNPPAVPTQSVAVQAVTEPAGAASHKQVSSASPADASSAAQHTPEATLMPAPTLTPVPPTSQPPTPTAMPTNTAIPTSVPTPIPTASVPASAEGVTSGIPTRLIVPAIGLDAPVVVMGWSVVEYNGEQVSEWDVPNWRAAGWLKISAPLGMPGNTVLEGHHNTDGLVFENLEYVKEGDTIQVYAGSEVHNYLVTTRMILPEKDQPMEVRLANAQWIARTDDERLTLITCYPRNNNTHRLVLVAYPQP